jgi:hypothetical protein
MPIASHHPIRLFPFKYQLRLIWVPLEDGQDDGGSPDDTTGIRFACLGLLQVFEVA